MKTKIISALLCIATILSMVGISSTSAFAYDYYESENNNSFANANTIDVNSYAHGATDDCSEYQTDDDYFKFTINEPGYVEIEIINNSHNSGIVFLYSYNGTDRKQLIDENISGAMEKFKTVKLGLDAGTYYLIMMSGTRNFNYSFKVNYVKSTNWEKETNNTLATANSISLNTAVYGSLYDPYEYNSDKDFFKFVVNTNGNINIDFRKNLSATGFWATLYSYDGTQKTKIADYSIDSESEKKITKDISVTAGTYYMQLHGRTSGYNFKINFTTGSAVKPTVKTTKPQANATRPTASTTRPTAAQPSYIAEPDATLPDYHDYDMVTDSSFDNNTYGENNYTPNEDNTYNEIFDDIDFNVKDMMNNGNFEYYIENGYITIHLYLGSDSEVVIPEYLNGYEVKGLASNLFADTDVKKVEVPSCVNEFGENAFGQNSGKDIEIVCEKNSPVEVYAKDNGIRYVYKPYSTDADTAKTNSTRNIIIIIAGVAAAVLVITATVLYFVKKKGTIRG